MLPKHSKKHLLEKILGEGFYSQKEVYCFLLFSNLNIESMNMVLPDSLKIKSEDIVSFFSYLYQIKPTYKEYSHEYGLTKSEINNFFDSRILTLFNELTEYQKYLLFKNKEFYPNHPEIFKKIFYDFLNSEEYEAHKFGISLENAIQIPKDCFEKLGRRKRLMILDVDFEMNDLERVVLNHEYLTTFETSMDLLWNFTYALKRLKARMIELERKFPKEYSIEFLKRNISSYQEYQIYILEHRDVLFTLFTKNKDDYQLTQVNKILNDCSDSLKYLANRIPKNN